MSADYAVVRRSSGTGLPNFTSANGSLTWQDGDASDKLISVTILDDTVNEGDDWLEIELTMPVGGAQLAGTGALVVIADNEAPPPPPPPPPTGPGASGGSSDGGGAAGWPLLLALALAWRFALRREQAHQPLAAVP